MNATTLRSGFGRRSSDKTLISPPQRNVAHRHAHAPRLDIDVTMRRCLHSGNDRLPREIAFEAAKLFRCDDNHFVTPMHRQALRSFTADASHQFAKARLGLLQEPVAGLPAVVPGAGATPACTDLSLT